MNRELCIAFSLALCFALSASPAAAQAQFERVLEGLNQPLFVTHAGDGSGRLFIVEQAGVIRIARGGALLPTPFLDIRSIVRSGGELGLLGLAFHPQYAANRRFFVNYTRRVDSQDQTVVAEYLASTSNSDRAEPDGRILLVFNQPYTNHNGGYVGFGPDGFLYIASGDGGSGGDPENRAQNLNMLLGKVLRIDVDSGTPYGIPPDNPFAAGGGRQEIWAYGLRNPFRMSFDSATGRLFAGDVGQNAWEEVDVIERGGNYGWNIVEGPACYPPGSSCDRTGLTPPIDFYGRDVGRSVTGGYVFRGPGNPGLVGRYVFGDFVSGRVFALTETSPGVWTRETLAETGFSISSFGEDQDGRLYLVDYGGRLWRFADQAAPDLEVSLDALGVFIQGSRAAYRVEVANQGSVEAVGETMVTVGVPAGLSFLSSQGSGWTCQEAAGEIRCSRQQALAAGNSSVLLLIVQAGLGAAPVIENQAQVANAQDSNPANNTANAQAVTVSPSRVPLTYSQLALGGGYTVILLVSNKSDQPWSGTARLREGNNQPWGAPWTLNGEDRAGMSEFPIQLGPGSSLRFELAGDAQAREGYLETVPGEGSSSLDIAASFFYELRDGAGVFFDSTGTPSGTPSAVFVLPVEGGSVAETGFAWAPFVQHGPFQIRLTLLDQDGVEVASQSVPYEGHFAAFLSELFAGIDEGFVGSLRLEALESFFLTALRLQGAAGTFQLTSVPPSPVP